MSGDDVRRGLDRLAVSGALYEPPPALPCLTVPGFMLGLVSLTFALSGVAAALLLYAAVFAPEALVR